MRRMALRARQGIREALGLNHVYRHRTKGRSAIRSALLVKSDEHLFMKGPGSRNVRGSSTDLRQMAVPPRTTGPTTYLTAGPVRLSDVVN